MTVEFDYPGEIKRLNRWLGETVRERDALQAQAVIDAQSAESLREKCGALEKERGEWKEKWDHATKQAHTWMGRDSERFESEVADRIKAEAERDAIQAQLARAEYMKDLPPLDQAFQKAVNELSDKYDGEISRLASERDAERQARAGLRDKTTRLCEAAKSVLAELDAMPPAKMLLNPNVLMGLQWCISQSEALTDDKGQTE